MRLSYPESRHKGMHSGNQNDCLDSRGLSMQKSSVRVRPWIFFFIVLFCVQPPAADRGDRDRTVRGENRSWLNSFTVPALVCLLERADIVFTAFSFPSLSLSSLLSLFLSLSLFPSDPPLSFFFFHSIQSTRIRLNEFQFLISNKLINLGEFNIYDINISKRLAKPYLVFSFSPLSSSKKTFKTFLFLKLASNQLAI